MEGEGLLVRPVIELRSVAGKSRCVARVVCAGAGGGGRKEEGEGVSDRLLLLKMHIWLKTITHAATARTWMHQQQFVKRHNVRKQHDVQLRPGSR